MKKIQRFIGTFLMFTACGIFVASCGSDKKSVNKDSKEKTEQVAAEEGPDEAAQVIDALNAECPVTLQEGLAITEVADGGEYIEFVVEYDESILSLDTTEEVVEAQKENFAQLFTEMIDTTPEIKTIADYGMDIRVTYRGSDSQNEFSFVLSYSDGEEE